MDTRLVALIIHTAIAEEIVSGEIQSIVTGIYQPVFAVFGMGKFGNKTYYLQTKMTDGTTGVTLETGLKDDRYFSWKTDTHTYMFKFKRRHTKYA